MVASSSLNIIPNSSKSSGSAFVVPRINLLKESVKSLPSAMDTFLAAPANCLIGQGLAPEALPIAAACDASLNSTAHL